MTGTGNIFDLVAVTKILCDPRLVAFAEKCPGLDEFFFQCHHAFFPFVENLFGFLTGTAPPILVDDTGDKPKSFIKLRY